MYKLGLWLGALMATMTLGTEPVNLLLTVDDRLSPANIVRGSAAYASTATEANLEVVVAPDADNIRDTSGRPGAVLRAGGSPTSALSLTATTAVPGTPGTNARYTYTDGTTTWGASEPFAPPMGLGYDTVRGVTSGNGYQQPAMTTTPDGYEHVVYETRLTGNGSLMLRSRPPSTQLWGTEFPVWNSIIANGPFQAMGTGGYLADPVIWWVRSDTACGYVLFVGAWYAESTSSQTFVVAQSTDLGITWAAYRSDLVVSLSGTDYRQQNTVVWDADSRQLSMFHRHVDGANLYGKLYVSNDPSGARWTAVSNGTISLAVTQVAMAHYCGTTYAAVLQGTSAVTIYRRDASRSGWDTITTDTGADFSNAYGLALAINDSGWVYLIGRSDADNDEVIVQVTTDGAENWGKPSGTYPYDDGAADIIMDDDATSGSTTFADGIIIHGAAWSTEGLALIGGLVTSATTTDNSVVVVRFGGITNITLSEAASGVDARYYPSSLPVTKSAQYQAFVTSGASTETLVTDALGRLALRISNDGSTGYEEYRLVGNPSAAAAQWTIGRYTSATSSTGVQLQVRAHNDANNDKYSLMVNVDWDSEVIQGHDIEASANIGSPGSFDNAKDLTLLAAVDGEDGVASLWYWQTGDLKFTNVFDNEALTAGGSTQLSRIFWGKLTASASQVDTLEMVPMGSASSGYVADLAAGFTSAYRRPIRATQNPRTPQRIPHDIHLWWTGTPLFAGDSHDIATVSRAPLDWLSPLAATPSPSLQWRGATGGGAGATYLEAFDLGADVEARLALGLMHVTWCNFPQAAAFRFRRWTGAAWQTEFEGSAYHRPFGADGAVGFTRGSAASTFFRPNAANGTPAYIQPGQYDGWWVRISDGTDAIGAYVLRTHPGQFSTTTGALQAAIEIDPSTIVVESGTFANLATSTTTGNMVFCAPDGCVIGINAIDPIRYVALEFDLAPGITVPEGGLFTAGPAHLLARREREGSSMRVVSPDDLTQLPGVGFIQSRRTRRKAQRVVELPFDTQLVQPGYHRGPGYLLNGIALSGSTVRGTVDSNLWVIDGVHRTAGQRVPVVLVQAASFTDEPSSTPAVFHGDQILVGMMEAQRDRTAARGGLRDWGIHAQHGGRLLVSELP